MQAIKITHAKTNNFLFSSNFVTVFYKRIVHFHQTHISFPRRSVFIGSFAHFFYILDGNDSDNDEPMDASYMEPQLMLDEYDEPVEFKFDPNATDSPSHDNNMSNMSQQARQQAYLLAAQQKHQQQLVEAAAAAAGGMQMSAVVGAGAMPGTVTLLNSMVSIPKLAPLVKPVKPKINKRVKLKQNGVDVKVCIYYCIEMDPK